MKYLLVFLIGIILGIVCAKFYFHKKSTYGSVLINEDDPEYATCGINFDSSIEEIKKHKYLVLNVKIAARYKQSH